MVCRASKRWIWSQPQGAWSPRAALSAAGETQEEKGHSRAGGPGAAQ